MSAEEARYGLARIIRDFLHPASFEIAESDYLLADRIIEWQASREVTDAEVEAATRALFEALKPSWVGPWEAFSGNERIIVTYREAARAALVAAREVRS